MFTFDSYFINLRINELFLCWFLFLGWWFIDIPWWILPSFVLWSTGFIYKIVRPGKRKQLEREIAQYLSGMQVLLPQQKTPEDKEKMN